MRGALSLRLRSGQAWAKGAVAIASGGRTSNLQLIVEVNPLWVDALDQPDLLPSWSSLDLLFPRDSRQGVWEDIEADQSIDVVLPGKPASLSRLVFVDSVSGHWSSRCRELRPAFWSRCRRDTASSMYPPLDAIAIPRCALGRRLPSVPSGSLAMTER